MAGIALAGMLTVVACSGDDDDDAAAPDGNEADNGSDAAATVPGDDWTVASPDDHGMDEATLEQARTYAFADGRNTQGVVVVHRGEIVAEWYADGADQDSWAASWSMAKSFTSALVGIAIDDGLIEGVDEPMTTWYPDWADTDKADITLKDVLQMSSGLDWDEDYDASAVAESEVIAMVVGEQDQLAFAAARPAAHEAGSTWSYSSGDAMLLSGVLEQATGMPADEYAQQELFDPLGIDQVEWWRDARGHTLTYCCLDTTSRDFARFGLLYEHQGRWGDDQVVPEGWVDDSLVPVADSDGDYGYQWWLYQPDDVPDDIFEANGHDGQFIYVIPSLDLVVVRNGTYVKDPGEPVADPTLFERYPSDGLVEGKGTSPPDDWDDGAFLGPIVQSLGS
ncbi:MAG TPA: serine hydrolase [Acidimicrobiales bacterium]|nr:serine hydrolase [Acidimicrobiales bacterium]